MLASRALLRSLLLFLVCASASVASPPAKHHAGSRPAIPQKTGTPAGPHAPALVVPSGSWSGRFLKT